MQVSTLIKLYQASRRVRALVYLNGPSSGDVEQRLDEEFEDYLRVIVDDKAKRLEFRAALWDQFMALESLYNSDV